ncbi:hypothetical protein SAMN05216474_3134 [Lishizhenia tianjinensis]|uniref:Uncharacterized protein n=1 Tax=Lishizhenia tianjinensis TaxID=477690 RepID=A0A1I7BW76_9FLAO|nr:hypothetical protein [Lishizhenia tianjinensis]SFT91443.1 hypothetical protein SAMN05216474_3134 [Lishizhenia tianjinensis]
MKYHLLLLGFCLSLSSIAQIKVQSPTIHYVSNWDLEEVKSIALGEKILFQQNCSPGLPENITNGVVFFENVYLEEERISVTITFKDTVVVGLTFHLKAKQYHVLSELGFEEIIGNTTTSKKSWTSTYIQDGITSVIVADRKKIVVVQSYNDREGG